MKRWLPALILAAACCIPLYSMRSSSPVLLQDTDTLAMLQGIQERDSPLSWFTSDWPLGNHFYRPLPTLTFELDNRLAPADPSQFGLTNALLCMGCTLLLFWFLRELTDSPWISVASTALFVGWQLDRSWMLGDSLPWLIPPIIGVGIWRHRLSFGPWMTASLAILYLSSQLSGMSFLYFRMIAWLPGRTASVMTLFALAALASYARYERLASGRLPPPSPTALDPNVSMKSEEPKAPKLPWVWVALAYLFTMGALASYEQAIMLPAILMGVAIVFRLSRRIPHWYAHIGFWLLLIGYWILRREFVPSEVSGYQAQQFRSGPGVWMSLVEYVLPCANLIQPMFEMLENGFLALFMSGFYQNLLGIASNISGITAVFRSKYWVTALGSFLMSLFAYLPMAWLKPFDHYHYWPMALRSVFVVLLGAATAQSVLIAISPPAVQAPSRQNPAPGSLRRR